MRVTFAHFSFILELYILCCVISAPPLVKSWEKCLDGDPDSGKLHISMGHLSVKRSMVNGQSMAEYGRVLA